MREFYNDNIIFSNIKDNDIETRQFCMGPIHNQIHQNYPFFLQDSINNDIKSNNISFYQPKSSTNPALDSGIGMFDENNKYYFKNIQVTANSGLTKRRILEYFIMLYRCTNSKYCNYKMKETSKKYYQRIDGIRQDWNIKNDST